MKMSRTVSKDKVLENYLNTIYFGRGAYGIEAAATTYFGVPRQGPDGGAGGRPRLQHPVARPATTRAGTPSGPRIAGPTSSTGW